MCKFSNFKVGDEVVLTVNSICHSDGPNACFQSTPMSKVLGIYKGHELINGINYDIVTLKTRLMCSGCFQMLGFISIECGEEGYLVQLPTSYILDLSQEILVIKEVSNDQR